MSQPERPAPRPAQNIERRLAAILSADVKGYSRLMGEDEEATLRTLTAHRQVMDALIAQHRGRIVGTAGDSVLAEFASVLDAVQCAVVIQTSLKAENTKLPPARQMEFRIGINLGDVMVDGEQIYGDGVNIAARLEALAEAGGICISGAVHDQVKNKLNQATEDWHTNAVTLSATKGLGMRFFAPLRMTRPSGRRAKCTNVMWFDLALTYEDLGAQAVKNIAEPVRTWRVVMDEAAAALAEQLMQRHPQPEVRSPASPKSRVGIAHRSWVVGLMASVLFIAGTIVVVRYLARPPFSTQDSALRTDATPAALPLPDKPSIVVLPFSNMSGDPQQEYFSDGLTEVLTSDLSRISSLFVIARNTAFTYKGKAANVQDVGRELGVRYVLEGSVQKTSDQVRINAQLIDATTGGHLWSERYDRPLKDIFALQDEIVQKIVTTLKLQLTLWEQGVLVRKTTDNLEAYDFYLRGQESSFRAATEAKKEANERARQMYERALELDPRYAGAYAGLGLTYFNDWFHRWNPTPQILARAGELARQAVTLDESLPEPHALLGLMYVWQKQHDVALKEAERAIALDPNLAVGYAWLGVILGFAGRPEEGIPMVEQAMRLNPRYSVWYLSNLGFTYRLAGRYEEAVAILKKALARQPNFPSAYFDLAVCYVQLDRLDEARAAVTEMQRLQPLWSPEGWRQMAPYKDPAVLEQDIAALRKAGWK